MPSIITSIIGGIQGASAATNAGNTAAGGQNAAGQTVTTAAGNANSLIGSSAATAGAGATQAAANAAGGVAGAASAAGGGALAAGNAAATGVTQAATNAGASALNAAGSANTLLNPYMQQGAQASTSLSQFMGPGGAGMTPFNASMMEANDPGYQFRLQQGQQALDRSASAHGSLMGGGQMKALLDYGQGAASSEYQNAFNRYTTQNQNTFNNLTSMSHTGQTAATQAGANMTDASQFAGRADMLGQQQAGQFNTQASQYAGNLGVAGAEYGGNAGINAAQYAGNAGMRSASEQSANTMGAATYTGNTQINAANDKAQGIIGRANSWNQMLGGIGQAGDMMLSGGMSSMSNGGSFLSGAFGGGAGGPDVNTPTWDPSTGREVYPSRRG
jgi:hypothetical protein